MRINWKKTMAGTLSVCMLATYAPENSEFGAFFQAIESVQAATETTYSGTCGAKAKWKYNAKTKTLTISGTGEMGNCTARQDASYEIIPPWEEREVKGWKVEKVVIGDGITKIGNYMFSECANIKEVKIGKKVKKVGKGAFSYCDSLETITLGNAVETIEKGAFYGCTSLKEVQLGKKIKEIGENAFYYCASLEKIQLGENVKEIKKGTFSRCKALKEINLGKSIQKIGTNAFKQCSALEKVTLGDNVKELGTKAFYDCEKLTSLNIGKSLKKIGSKAFDKCYDVSNVTVHADNKYFEMNDNILMNKGKTKIYLGSFGTNATCNVASSVTTLDLAVIGNTKLENFAVSSENGTYSSEEGLLYTKDKSQLLVCPRGKKGTATVSEKTERMDYQSSTAIVKAYPFKGCANIEKIIVGKNVKYMDSVFSGCDSLKEVEVNAENASYASDKGSILSKDRTILLYFVVAEEDGTYTVPHSVTQIGKYAFSGGVKKPNHIILSDGVQSFIDINFHIDSITLGKNFKDISNICWIENIYLSEENLYYRLIDGVFYNKEQTEMIKVLADAKVCNMPQTVNSVAADALGDKSGELDLQELYVSDQITDMTKWFKGNDLKKVHIGKSVNAVSRIETKQLETLTVSPENQTYKSQDNILYTKDGKQLIWCPQGKTGTINVCTGTSIIEKEAFKNAGKVTKIIISDKLKKVGENAFCGIDEKATFIVPKGMKVYYKSMFDSETGFDYGMKIKEAE